MTFVLNFVWLKRNPSLGNGFHETTENIANSAWCNKSKLLSIPTVAKHISKISKHVSTLCLARLWNTVYTLWLFDSLAQYTFVTCITCVLKNLYIFGKRMFGGNYFWSILSVICLFIFQTDIPFLLSTNQPKAFN